MAYNRRRRFASRAGAPAQPVRETHRGACPYKRQRCSGCRGFILAGESCVRFALAKRYRTRCDKCGAEPRGARWFHDPACVPADVNKAMGYDPVNVNPSAAVPSAAPPPKVLNARDLQLEALVHLEAAVVAKARERGVTPEMEKAFKTFSAIKARVLRPTTVEEGDVSVTMALKRIIDLVYT